MKEVPPLKKLIVSILILFGLGTGLGWWLREHPASSAIKQIPSPTLVSSFRSELSPKTMKLHVVGIGDSLTKGVGDEKDQGYAGITISELSKKFAFSSISFNDEGVTGDTTDDLLKVLQKKKVQQEIVSANLIFLSIGGNDIVAVLKDHFLNLDFSEFDQQRRHYTSNLNEILKEVRQLNPTATIYYLGLYNPFEDYFTGLNAPFETVLDQWNQAGKTILELYPHTVFIPTFDLFHGKTSELLYKDHFHPNEKGYQLIAKRIVSQFSVQGTPH